ncbi:lipid II:glycine glycyltransferase FemX [Maricaulis sp. MIT060901]|uniref:lipid II:glycine glycyltransferase FemX n=1 Tax=Maricaulis sp. MIT060901 TaxID=3096993 RepID=UPI00399AD626
MILVNQSMQISTDISRDQWDKALAETPASLQQDWSYGDALASVGANVVRVVIEDDAGQLALAQFTTRKIGMMVNVGLCSRGPVWLREVSTEQRRQVHRALKSALGLGWPRVTLQTPDDVDPPGGARRVVSGYSTVMLDLTQSLADLRAGFDGKWRNRLVAAEKSALKVQQNGTKPAQYIWLLETEEGQRKDRGYTATPAALVPEFVKAKGDRDSLLILRGDLGKQKAAAMLFLIHGCAATYHIGWNSEEGRKLGAHNLLLWQALDVLKQRGVKRLDLGGVETLKSAGRARFKLGTGGQLITYAGTYF